MSKYESGKLKLYNMDCMELLKQTPDKYYNLCIVDPPYGIGASNMSLGKWGGSKLKKKEWDSLPPDEQFFKELFRVSKSWIIWGANYFGLPSSRGFIVWDKGAGFKGRDFAECELAFTSFDTNARIYQYDPLAGRDYVGRIHKTQKPVALYKWLLHNYAKQGDKILDTHGGSMSIAIACHQMGFDLTLTELDKDYFDAGVKRVIAETAQLDLLQA